MDAGMSAVLADGVVAIVKAATAPLIEEIKGLRAEVAALKAIPPVPGPPGPQGERGEIGPAGRDGINGLDGKDGSAGDRGPEGPAGPQGDTGASGSDGAPGPAGRDGLDGKDGVGLADMVIDREHQLVATMTDGRTKTLGVVVGAKGEKGQDGTNGRDGFGFEDLDFETDDRGRLFHVYRRGDEVKRVRVPGFHFQERYKAGTEYVIGDTVQWGGHLWVACVDGPLVAPESGPVAAKQWRMAVRRGSQGERGEKGEPGERGARGEKGDRGPERW